LETHLKDTAASQRFIDGLEQGDLALLRAVPKGDLHHHSWMGGAPPIHM
jgi:hypothetical protein